MKLQRRRVLFFLGSLGAAAAAAWVLVLRLRRPDSSPETERAPVSTAQQRLVRALLGVGAGDSIDNLTRVGTLSQVPDRVNLRSLADRVEAHVSEGGELRLDKLDKDERKWVWRLIADLQDTQPARDAARVDPSGCLEDAAVHTLSPAALRTRFPHRP